MFDSHHLKWNRFIFLDHWDGGGSNSPRLFVRN
jgi:hypothetical protein